ncbi:MAG: diaminopimelate epimerase [Bacteroidetes bacterium]|nr:MAG: diaminopimelate epimerase [Bacteroidota bacterium]
MHLNFYKYHGTGNDFILIDNRDLSINLSNKDIEFLCNRHFGIGADGLMTLENDNNFDFKMKYYNSDGNEGTMCGNGGRCIVAFAKKLNIINNKTHFIAVDGEHFANIYENDIVKLKMNDVNEIKKIKNGYFLDTGSPHYIEFINDIDNFDVYSNGKKLRYSKDFEPNGTNVNFVKKINKQNIFVATYERGVENETLSCGTGVTASALVYAIDNNISDFVEIKTKGGELKIFFEQKNNTFTNIWLQGKTKFVFNGTILI